MLLPEITRIMKENEKYTKMLEEYDRTGVFPLDRTRHTFSLRNKTVNKLKEVSQKTGESMSGIIERLVDSAL